MKRTVFCFLTVLFLITSMTPVFALNDFDTSSEALLKDNDVIALLGDSLTGGTQQSGYSHTGWYIPMEYYMVTRFPSRNIRLINCGIPSITTDQVYRYQMGDEIAGYTFNKAMVYLGTNDIVGYSSTLWKANYESLLTKLEKRNAEIFCLITPAGTDTVNDADSATRNITMGAIARDVVTVANTRNLFVADQYDGFQKIHNEKKVRLFQNDYLHHTAEGSAYTFLCVLEGCNLPGEVATVLIDFGTVEKEGNCKVSQFAVQGDTMRFSYLANALPMSDSVDFMAAGEMISDYLDTVSREMLQITGLAEGTYTLKIDGVTVASFSEKDLQKGVNLAKFDTPMAKQADAVAEIVMEMGETQRAERELSRTRFYAFMESGATTEEEREAWILQKVIEKDRYSGRYYKYLFENQTLSVEARREKIDELWTKAYETAQPTEHLIELISDQGDMVISQKPSAPVTPDDPVAPSGNLLPVIIAVVAVVVVAGLIICLIYRKKR